MIYALLALYVITASIVAYLCFVIYLTIQNYKYKKKQDWLMDVVCAWCGKNLGKKDGKGVEGVSHGICSECAAILKAKDNSNRIEQ